MRTAWQRSGSRNHRPAFEASELRTFAVLFREEGTLIGGIMLHLNARDENAELGYWIGKSYWRLGYCTEAAKELVRYGFEELGLHPIHSNHFGSNHASGRAMQKVGMSYEGTQPEQYKKWGAYDDRVEYGLLARDRHKAASRPGARTSSGNTPCRQPGEWRQRAAPTLHTFFFFGHG